MQNHLPETQTCEHFEFQNSPREYCIPSGEKKTLKVISFTLLFISGYLSASCLWKWMRTGQTNGMVLALGSLGVFYAGYLIHSLRPWLKSVSLNDSGLYLQTRNGIKSHSWEEIERVKSYTLNYPNDQHRMRHLALENDSEVILVVADSWLEEFDDFEKLLNASCETQQIEWIDLGERDSEEAV